MSTITASQGLASLINFLTGGTASLADASNGAQAALSTSSDSGGSQQPNSWGATIDRILSGISASSDVTGVTASGGQMLQQFAQNSSEAGALLGRISESAGQLGLAASISSVINQAFRDPGAISSGQLDSIAGVALGLAAAGAATPEVAIALGFLAAGMTVLGLVTQSPEYSISNALTQLQGIIQPYYNQLSATDQATFAKALSSTTQLLWSGGMMVPQVDSSGQITGYEADIPTATIPQADGSTLYTFSSGATYVQGSMAAIGPLTNSAAASEGENIWTIPEAGTANALTLGTYQDGSYSEAYPDSSNNAVAEVYIAGSSETFTVASANSPGSSEFVCTVGSNDLVNIAPGSFVSLQGTNNTVNESGGMVQIASSGTIDGGGNGISVGNDGSGATIMLEGTGSNADTLSVAAGATGVTVQLGDSTSAIALGINSSLTVQAVNGGGAIDGTAGDTVTIGGDGVTLNASGGTYALTGNNDIVNANDASVMVNPDAYDGPNSWTAINGSNDDIDVGSWGTVTLTGGDDIVQVDDGGYGYVRLVSGSNYTVDVARGGVKVYGQQDDDIAVGTGYEDFYTDAGLQTGQIGLTNGHVTEQATFMPDGTMAENQYFYLTGQISQDTLYVGLANGESERIVGYSTDGAPTNLVVQYSAGYWTETNYYSGDSGVQLTSDTRTIAGAIYGGGALLSEMSDFNNGTSSVSTMQDGILPSGESEETKHFSGLDGTGTETAAEIYFTDGEYQSQTFTGLPDGVTAEVYNYTAPPLLLGTETSLITNYTDGTSSEFFYSGLTSDETSVTSWFDGLNATGLAKTVINFRDQTSQVDLFSGFSANESEMIENFDELNGAGAETWAITNYTTGGSSETFYAGLADGISNETEWFSGVDATGSITQALLNLTDGQSQIQQFSGLPGSESESVENFADANAAGQEIWSLTNYSDGSSSETFYTGLQPGLSSETDLYSEAGGNGQVTGETISFTDGSSQVQLFSGLPGGDSSVAEDFSGANGTGTETWSMTDYTSGGSSISWYTGLPAGQLSQTGWYSGADGTGVTTGGLINFSDGNSQTLQFTGLPGGDSSVIDAFTGANGTGAEQWAITNHTDGSSIAQIFSDLPSDDASVYQNYTGGDASGTLTTTTINFTAGGSEVQYTTGLGSEISLEAMTFSGADATGSLLAELTNFDSGSSQVTYLSGLPDGEEKVTLNFTGLDGSGQLTSDATQQTNGGSDLVTFNYDANGNETSYEEQYFGAGGGQIGYSDYDAAGNWTGGDIFNANGITLYLGPEDGGYFDGGYFGDDFFGGSDFGGDFGGYGLAGSKATVQAAMANSAGSIARADLAQGDQMGADAAESALDQARAVSAATPTSGGGNAVLEGARWDSQVITWNFTAPAGVDATVGAAYMAQGQQALDAWASATSLSLQEVFDPSQADIRIGFGQLDTAGSGVVGYTSGRALAGVIGSTDIELEDPTQDALAAGADGQLTYESTGATFEQILLHEIGHALGFADNPDQNSVMYYELTSANRTLDGTDLAGAISLYGQGASPDIGVGQLIQAMASYSVVPAGSVAITSRNEPLIQELQLAAH